MRSHPRSRDRAFLRSPLQLTRREVKLFLPRFRITWGPANLLDSLSGLGMPIAFEQFRADFSGINGCRPPDEESLFISSVLHKAFVEVNEEGTEAAAATAEVMVAAPMIRLIPPKRRLFRADHPFIFAIRDRSGTILFLGRVSDPTKES